MREPQALQKALEEIGNIRKQAADLKISGLKPYNSEVADAIELSHMFASAEAIVLSALERKESRGAHVRSDFPERDGKSPVKNAVVKMKNGKCEIRLVDVGS